MVETRSGSQKMDLTEKLTDYLNTRFDQLLTSLATKDDINSLRNEVTKLISDSVESQGKIIYSLKNKVEKLEAENVVLQRHLLASPRSARRPRAILTKAFPSN